MPEREDGGAGRAGDGTEAYLELRTRGERELLPLRTDRVAIGKAPSNDVAVDDAQVSRLHAVLERFPSGWVVRDLDSTNGTFLNGDRVWTDRPVHDGDQILVGATTLVMRTGVPGERRSTTEAAFSRPDVTRRERDVLVALCAPLADGDVFTEPASIRDVAAALVVTDAAVKQHLAHLYDKFGLHDADRRRVRLANEALRRGVVTLADLRAFRAP